MPQDQLFSTQLEILMRNLARGTVMAHVAGIIVALLLLWTMVKPLLLFAWTTVLLLLLLLRSWHMQHTLDIGAHKVNPRQVCWQLLLGISMTGLCWSGAYIYVASVAPSNVQYIFLLIVALLASLSLGPSVLVREYYIAFLMTTLYPIGWWNLVHFWDYPFNAVVGVMLLLATAVLVLVCTGMYRSYRQMLELNWHRELMAAESAALAEKLKQRNEQLTEARHRLSEQARVDELTGLYNRRGLNERLAAELRRCSRFNTPLAVIMLDVDHFKDYNDHYGHQAGDEVLKRLAQVLLEAANRAGDVVARYGGEEFMVVMPGTDAAAARAVAARIRETLEEEQMRHEFSPVADHITVSQGLAWAPPAARLSSHELIEKADEALYAAKAGGRNTIVSL